MNGVPNQGMYSNALPNNSGYPPQGMLSMPGMGMNPPSMSSALLESTSSHLIALSPQSLPPNRIKLKIIIGEKVNNMVHELPSLTNDQRYGYNPLGGYGYPGGPFGSYLNNPSQRGIFDRLFGAFGSDSLRGWMGLVMFVLGIIGWRRFGR